MCAIKWCADLVGEMRKALGDRPCVDKGRVINFTNQQHARNGVLVADYHGQLWVET